MMDQKGPACIFRGQSVRARGALIAACLAALVAGCAGPVRVTAVGLREVVKRAYEERLAQKPRGLASVHYVLTYNVQVAGLPFVAVVPLIGVLDAPADGPGGTFCMVTGGPALLGRRWPSAASLCEILILENGRALCNFALLEFDAKAGEWRERWRIEQGEDAE